MNYFHVACIFLIGALLLLLAYYILVIYSNRAIEREERNSFLNSFPYLYYQNMPMSMRLFLYILLGVGVVMLGLGESFFFSAITFSSYQLALAILFPIASLCLYLSNILSLNYYKMHLITSILGFFFFASACLLTGLVTFVSGTGINMYYNRAITIVIGVIGLLCFLSLLNPKLANWAKMQKTEVNGKVVYIRPKVNFYALYEWIYLSLNGIVGLLIVINIFVAGLQ